MKYVLMNSSESSKKMNRKIVPQEKKRELVLKGKNKEKVEEIKKIEETEEKEVDVAQYNIKDDEASIELKKRTDDVLRGYFKGDAPTSLTYLGFEKDMNAVVENILSDQDKKKREKKKEERKQKIKNFTDKLFRRRKDG